MSLLEIQKCSCRFKGNLVCNAKWSELVRAVLRSQGLGMNSPRELHQHPAVQGVLAWGGRSWELQFEWLSCTIRYRELCVMPAGLIVLCLLLCGWIPSSSYLKNTWAAHNFRLSHSSEAVVTTWLFKAMSCLPCLAELGYSLHLYIPNSWAASKRFFSWPALLPEILQLSDLNVEPWLCLKLGNFWPASSGRMFGIEDCEMGGLNRHLSCLIHCWTFH